MKPDRKIKTRRSQARRGLRVAGCGLRVAIAVFCAGTTVRENAAADIDVSKLPPATQRPVDYERDIRPIFENSCLRCHGPERPKSRFRLDNRESALKGGENDTDDIIPGNSANSKLIHYVCRVVEDREMPPAGKGEPLTAEQIGLLRAWIDQGANWPVQSRETTVSITPTVRWVTVEGNERKFREDWWQKPGFTAGYEHFEMRQPVGRDGTLAVEGRALFAQEDYRVALTLSRPDLGFVRGGYETYRKYFNDLGGEYAPYNLPAAGLNRDLFLDNGKAWFDLGLTLPDWPKLVVGYEYQFKAGDKSTLQWGQISNDPTAFFGKAIYPGYKAIDEHTHVLKVDLSHEIGGYSFEDNFRAEWYGLSTTRINRGDFSPDTIARHQERYSHTQEANAFRVEKQPCDWLLVSGGYLYTHLEGDGAFNQVFSSISSAFPAFTGDSSDRISLMQRSHTVNLNAMLGPWDGLTISAGAQTDWTRREGLTDLLGLGFPSPTPGAQTANLDKTTLDENVGLRYTKIPFTVLYAEGRFQQEWDDHFEREFIDDAFDDNRDFSRDTDATSRLKEYRVGFTVSPWPRVSFEPSYRHREKQSHFDHKIDQDLSPDPMLSGNGYPAFIRARDTTSDQIELKLVLRPLSWLKTTLKYQLMAVDYDTTVDPSYFLTIVDDGFTNIFFPGGEIRAGNQDAHVYSANVTLTPWRRLYFSTTFSYSQSRIQSGVNNGTTVVPYRGDVYSVLSSANWVLTKSTDVHASYSFSRADYRQHNEAEGLPLGIFYDRHAIMAGFTRRLLKNMTGTLQYGFFYYNEPTSGGANNYRAHAVMASLNMALP